LARHTNKWDPTFQIQEMPPMKEEQLLGLVSSKPHTLRDQENASSIQTACAQYLQDSSVISQSDERYALTIAARETCRPGLHTPTMTACIGDQLPLSRMGGNDLHHKHICIAPTLRPVLPFPDQRSQSGHQSPYPYSNHHMVLALAFVFVFVFAIIATIL